MVHWDKLGLKMTAICIILLLSILEVTAEQLTLTYKDFDELNGVCSYDNNWCGYANRYGKAVVYGYMKKEIEVPAGADELDVTIHTCCNGWGEGLAVDVDLWTPDSAALVIVDGEAKEEKISKSNVHHHSYYKYEFCESFTNTFNVSGKRKITLEIRMRDGARLDFQKAVLKFKSKKAYLSVRSDPNNAEVFVDGKKIGLTPLDCEVKEGMHIIEVIKESYEPYKTTVNVKAGETKIINVHLERNPKISETPVSPPAKKQKRQKSAKGLQLSL